MTVQDLIDPRCILKHKRPLPRYPKELFKSRHSLSRAQRDGALSLLLGSQLTPLYRCLLFGVELLPSDRKWRVMRG